MNARLPLVVVTTFPASDSVINHAWSPETQTYRTNQNVNTHRSDPPRHDYETKRTHTHIPRPETHHSRDYWLQLNSVIWFKSSGIIMQSNFDTIAMHKVNASTTFFAEIFGIILSLTWSTPIDNTAPSSCLSNREPRNDYRCWVVLDLEISRLQSDLIWISCKKMFIQPATKLHRSSTPRQNMLS